MPQVSHSVPLTTNATACRPIPVEQVTLNNKSIIPSGAIFAD